MTHRLESYRFTDTKVGTGRTVIGFSGNAASVRRAFHTEIHRYLVRGEEHFANATDPQIPAALRPLIAGIVSLHNFRKKPMDHLAHFSSTKRGAFTSAGPEFTNSCFDGITGSAIRSAHTILRQSTTSYISGILRRLSTVRDTIGQRPASISQRMNGCAVRCFRF